MPRRFQSPQEKRTYQCWSDMKSRCSNRDHKRYANYGGRGITVCRRWTQSFDNFVEDMGLKPDGLTIDRVDNNGNYTPNNCRWATYRQQNKNTRRNTVYEYKGKAQTIEEWADELGMHRTTLSKRVHTYGWPIQVALEAPPQFIENLPDDPEKLKHVPKLDLETAEEIRAKHRETGWSLARLGRWFGVSRTTIYRVVYGKVHTS